MRDLNFFNAGSETTRGPRAVVVVARRGLRWLLRPVFLRLAEILESVVNRLDRAEALTDLSLKKFETVDSRLDTAEWHDAVFRKQADGLMAHLAGLNEEFLDVQAEVRRFCDGPARLDSAEWNLAVLHKRTDGLMAHLAGLNQDCLAFQNEIRGLPGAPGRFDSAEARLDSGEWNIAVLKQRADGLTAHLAGLTDDHRALYTEVQSRIAQVSALSESLHNHGRRQDEIDDTFQSVRALHWDHVALARRLAVIEDLLAIPPAREATDATPFLPFPGLDDEVRSRVG